MTEAWTLEVILAINLKSMYRMKWRDKLLMLTTGWPRTKPNGYQLIT